MANLLIRELYGQLQADVDAGTQPPVQTGSPELLIVTDPPCSAEHAYEMFVDNKDGFITIGLAHLRTSPDDILYLDIIHELCHVQQYRQGRNLYDRRRAYVDRDTEIEAYLVTVQEARRIGLNDEAIADYLRVAWLTPQEHQRLARRLNVTVNMRDDDQKS